MSRLKKLSGNDYNIISDEDLKNIAKKIIKNVDESMNEIEYKDFIITDPNVAADATLDLLKADLMPLVIEEFSKLIEEIKKRIE